jgi:hypothetical protein
VGFTPCQATAVYRALAGTGLCSIDVRLNAGAAWQYLHLAEINMYNNAGNLMSKNGLAALSTVYDSNGEYFPAANCVDGNAATVCGTAAGDASARLRVHYACPTGWTRGSLSRVVVTNRAGDSALMARINSFTLDFRNMAGAIDTPSYAFAGGAASYTITPGVQQEPRLP